MTAGRLGDNIYRDLPREFCEAFLLDHGILVYDKDDDETLRHVIETSVGAGTFKTSAIEPALEAWERERRGSALSPFLYQIRDRENA